MAPLISEPTVSNLSSISCKIFKMAAFEKQKASCLSQVDLSKKGNIDDQIIDLVQYINAKDNYFTTSSCSGRISVFSELADQRKKHCEWLYVTHSAAIEEEVIESLKGCHGSAVFKFEPFVLHVQCKDLVAGQQMLKVALVSGFKNSGIVIGRKANVIVAVRSTQSLEVPLVHKGELMVSYKVVKVKFFEAKPLILFATFIAEDRGLLKLKVIEYVALYLDIFKYIEFLVNAANKKLDENQTRINRFFENLRQSSTESDNSNCTLQKTGRTPNIKRSRQDELPVVHVTSLESNLDAPELCDDDALDCLASFYGGVS